MCPEGEIAQLEKYNPLIAKDMVYGPIGGLMHYLRSWEYDDVSIEQCVYCGETWVWSKPD